MKLPFQKMRMFCIVIIWPAVLQGVTLVLALVGFNLGVEIGQIGILSVYVPISYAMRRTRFYKHMVFYVGSMLIICVAGAWLAERVLNIELFSMANFAALINSVKTIL